MVLAGEAPIGFLDVIGRRRLGNAKDVIVIARSCGHATSDDNSLRSLLDQLTDCVIGLQGLKGFIHPDGVALARAMSLQ